MSTQTVTISHYDESISDDVFNLEVKFSYHPPIDGGIYEPSEDEEIFIEGLSSNGESMDFLMDDNEALTEIEINALSVFHSNFD